jgi:hypothetical protein
MNHVSCYITKDICVHCRFAIDREKLVAIADKTTYTRHVSPWLFGDLGSHLKSQRANEPSLEPETISSAEKINYLSNSLWPAFADYTFRLNGIDSAIQARQ